MDADCAADVFSHTWHLNWWTAMGRAYAHRGKVHA